MQALVSTSTLYVCEYNRFRLPFYSLADLAISLLAIGITTL